MGKWRKNTEITHLPPHVQESLRQRQKENLRAVRSFAELMLTHPCLDEEGRQQVLAFCRFCATHVEIPDGISPLPASEIDWNSYDDEQFTAVFRFSCHADIVRLAETLQLPEMITYAPSGCHADRVTALAVLLARLSSPSRLDTEMQDRVHLHRSAGWFSAIINATAEEILKRWDHLLTCDSRWLPSRASEFAAAIHRKGAPLDHIVGFVDGVTFKVCRTAQNHHCLFSSEHLPS